MMTIGSLFSIHSASKISVNFPILAPKVDRKRETISILSEILHYSAVYVIKCGGVGTKFLLIRPPNVVKIPIVMKIRVKYSVETDNLDLTMMKMW